FFLLPKSGSKERAMTSSGAVSVPNQPRLQRWLAWGSTSGRLRRGLWPHRPLAPSKQRHALLVEMEQGTFCKAFSLQGQYSSSKPFLSRLLLLPADLVAA